MLQHHLSEVHELFAKPLLSSAISLIVTRLNKLFAFLELRWKLISITCSVLTTCIFISQLLNSGNWLILRGRWKKPNFFFFSSEWMNLKINIQKLGVSPVLTLQVYMLDIFGCLNVPAGGKKQAVLEHGLF